MAEMTERQARAWGDAVAEVNKRGGAHLPEAFESWDVQWRDESRPGRGQYLSATVCDGEHFAQIMMDVYGYPLVSVAEVRWIHSSSDEQCECGCLDDPTPQGSGEGDR